MDTTTPCTCNAAQALVSEQAKNAQLRRQMAATNGVAAQLLPGTVNRWTTINCGVFQGFMIEAPTFTVDDENQKCELADGGCTIEHPRGGWSTLLLIRGLTAGATVVIKIFTTTAACIPALSFMSVLDNITQDEVPPTRVTVGEWTSGRQRQLFPGWGKDSQAEVGGVSITDIEDQETERLLLPITYYTEQNLIDGQNNQPGIMARINTIQNQTGFGFSVNNGQPRTIDFVVKLYVAYGYMKTN
jgi:hypothetical protein